MGAWIETYSVGEHNCLSIVAPCMGAWIETFVKMLISYNNMSHPVWVRGLKHFQLYYHLHQYLVAPCMGAWIETII